MALAISGAVQAEVPKLLTQRSFTAASLTEAVNHYVDMGEAATLEELDHFLAEDSARTNNLFNRGYSVDERIGWLLRILYLPKPGVPMTIPKTGVRVPGRVVPLRPPDFGWLGIPEKSMAAEQWPLFPLALSGSTYIVLKEGYTQKASSETIQHYMKYCRDNGDFRKTPVAVPTRQSALKDIEAFQQSERWKAIPWMNNGGIGFPRGEEWTLQFIHRQARNIPEATAAK